MSSRAGYAWSGRERKEIVAPFEVTRDEWQPPMNHAHPNDPLHGITLEKILTQLVEHYGWDELGRMIPIRCFNFDPSIQSSLKFLRKTPWARKRVEDLYVWFKTPARE
jgi:uncharacterized protein (DUF2132 family)